MDRHYHVARLLAFWFVVMNKELLFHTTIITGENHISATIKRKHGEQNGNFLISCLADISNLKIFEQRLHRRFLNLNFLTISLSTIITKPHVGIEPTPTGYKPIALPLHQWGKTKSYYDEHWDVSFKS